MKFFYRIVLFVLTFVAVIPCAESQKTENRSVAVRQLDGMQLPAAMTDLYFLDGSVRMSSCGMALSAAYSKGFTGNAQIDTTLLAIDPQITYVVRRPNSGEVYFTKCDGKGKSYLYERYEKKPGKYEVRKVKPSRFSFTIEHPVFSPDGHAMIFSSDCPLGFGGRDLWYSEWSSGEWQYPQNMGHRVNSEGDELSPSMCGDYLLFASNGRSGGYGGFDLYSTRLVVSEQTGDTVSMFPIGRSAVYSLEAPFCSPDDDFAIAVNGSRDCGWWVTRDTNGVETLYQFNGGLESVRLSGTVSSAGGSPVQEATVTVRSAGMPDVKVDCGRTGRYAIFLLPGVEYELVFAADEYFSVTMPIVAEHRDAERLYNVDHQNVELQRFFIDTVYSYGDLFNSSAGSELSASGRKRMELLARYMVENPQLKLTITSTYNQNSDVTFCRLLNQSRLRSLTDFLTGKGVPSGMIETSTRVPRKMPVARAADESAASQSSKTVTFVFSR